VVAVGPIAITVSSLDQALDFYTSVLPFEKVMETRMSGDDFARLTGVPGAHIRVATLRLGDDSIELTEFVSPKGRPFPPDSRSNDHWFQHIAIIVRDMEAAHALLDEKMVEHASKAPQRLPDWNVNAGGIKAFYFRDPDGHYLEILQFPSGKGHAKWHRPTDKLFLGIDHTAIVVGDTDASLKFYRDVLGLRVVGASENYGMEQEDLNNVPGAHLRITTLRAANGPAIEFLEYLMPRDGRPLPSDARVNDLLCWQTSLTIEDAAELLRQLKAGGYTLVSSVETDSLGPANPILVRDPDGHVMRIQASK